MRPRRAAALALTAVLTLGALAATRAEEGPGTGTVATTPSIARSASTPVPTMRPSSTSTATGPPTTARVEIESDPLDVIQEALSAWGRFAVTGDLDDVEPWFAVDGPQYRQFVDEAAAAERVGGPAYRVMFEATETDPVDSNRVRGRVVFVRSGEPSQSFDWWIVLRERRGRLLVWTVEQADER